MTSQEYSYQVNLIMRPHWAQRATNPVHTSRLVNCAKKAVSEKKRKEKENERKRKRREVLIHLCCLGVKVLFGDLEWFQGLLQFRELVLLWLDALCFEQTNKQTNTNTNTNIQH